jgi:hypothetical protein
LENVGKLNLLIRFESLKKYRASLGHSCFIRVMERVIKRENIYSYPTHHKIAPKKFCIKKFVQNIRPVLQD